MNCLNKVFFIRLFLSLLLIFFISCKQKTILEKETIYRDSVIVRDTILKIKPDVFFVRDTIKEINFVREYIDKGGNKITIIKRDSLIYVKCNPAEIETLLKKYFIKSESKTKEIQEKDITKNYFYVMLIFIFSLCVILIFKK